MFKRLSFITALLLFVLFITACPNAMMPTETEVWNIVKSGSTTIPKGSITLTLNTDGTGSQTVNDVSGATFNYSISNGKFTVSNLFGAITFVHNGIYTMTKTDSTLKLVPSDVSEQKAETIEATK